MTGTSVIAIKYVDGVMLAADTLGSYGSLTRFTDLERLYKTGDNTIVGAGGEYSDFQYIKELLEELRCVPTERWCALPHGCLHAVVCGTRRRTERAHEDGCKLAPNEIHSYLTRVMYNRRSKGNPLWNELVIAGLDNDGKR